MLEIGKRDLENLEPYQEQILIRIDLSFDYIDVTLEQSNLVLTQ